MSFFSSIEKSSQDFGKEVERAVDGATHDNAHSLDDKTNAHSLDDTTDAHSLDDTTNAHSLDDTNNTHSLDDTTNPHSLDDTTNAHSLDDTTNAHSLDETTNAHSLDDTPNDDVISQLPLYDDELFKEKDTTSKKSASHYHKRKDTLLYERVASYPNYLDTHCHLEYLLEKHRLSSYSALKSKFSYPLNFDGCITSFCDTMGFSSFSCAEEVLQERGVWASFGIHPHHSYTYNDKLEDKLIAWLSHPKCVALGEIGLDYSNHSLRYSTKSQQIKVFQRMLTLAQSFNKPLVIHCRGAENDLYDILTTCSGFPIDWFIHLHCYTGSVEMAHKFINKFPNLYLGLTGHVTLYKFESSREIATNMSLCRILIETDSPYMVPYSMKKSSKWSHPPMSVCVAQEIAKLRHYCSCTVDEVLMITRENARRMYGI